MLQTKHRPTSRASGAALTYAGRYGLFTPVAIAGETIWMRRSLPSGHLVPRFLEGES